MTYHRKSASLSEESVSGLNLLRLRCEQSRQFLFVCDASSCFDSDLSNIIRSVEVHSVHVGNSLGIEVRFPAKLGARDFRNRPNGSKNI